MEFLKAHYEKIILSVVLLGLAAAAALMPIKVSQERQKEEDRKNTTVRGKVTEFPPVDLSTNEAVLGRLSADAKFKFSGEHNLFNPVRWQRTADGRIIRASDTGLQAVKVTEIKPLMLRVSYEGTTGSGESLKYVISVVKETERAGAQKRTAGKGQKNPLFTLQDVAGPADNPASLVLLLDGDRQPVTISKEMPYERVIGYAADITYEPEKLKRTVKVKDDLTFGGESYTIVAITPKEVVFSAKSNKKQTPIPSQK